MADLNAVGFENSFDTESNTLSIKLTSNNPLEFLKEFCLKTLELVEPIVGGGAATSAKSPRREEDRPGTKPSLHYMTLPDESYSIVPAKVFSLFCFVDSEPNVTTTKKHFKEGENSLPATSSNYDSVAAIIAPTTTSTTST